MADTAFQTMYRQEFITGFETHVSLLSRCGTNEAQIKGNTAVFMVADSNGATAVTRGVNGLIPARADNLTQNSCTIAEWHDLVRKTSFNIFASQGDQRRIMQMTSMGVINRKIDTDIIDALDTDGASYRAGATAVTGSLNLVTRAKTILGNNAVPMGNNIFAAITPAFYGYLQQAKEFSNVEYINRKPFQNPDDFNDQPLAFDWNGVMWIVHPGLTGVGTSSAKCYMWHRAAWGHATDTRGLQSLVGYDDEQDYSWARVSMNMGTKVLQAKGIVQMLHDDSAFVSA